MSARRARLRQLGLARAAGFTWRRCAAETLATLRAALARSAAPMTTTNGR